MASKSASLDRCQAPPWAGAFAQFTWFFCKFLQKKTLVSTPLVC